MNISGIRPEPGFYESVKAQEKEEVTSFKLNQVAIRMVDMPPLLSDIPMDNPQAAVEVMADILKDYDREVLAIINMRSDLKPINMNIGNILKTLKIHILKKLNLFQSTR